MLPPKLQETLSRTSAEIEQFTNYLHSTHTKHTPLPFESERIQGFIDSIQSSKAALQEFQGTEPLSLDPQLSQRISEAIAEILSEQKEFVDESVEEGTKLVAALEALQEFQVFLKEMGKRKDDTWLKRGKKAEQVDQDSL